MDMQKLLVEAQGHIGPQPEPVYNPNNIPQDKALTTIDKFALKVIPKLIDKIRMLEYDNQLYGYVLARLAELISDSPKPKRRRRATEKQELEINPDLYSNLAPDGTRHPLVIGGMPINGALVNAIESMDAVAAATIYGNDVGWYVNSLPQEVRNAIKEAFPDEISGD